MKKLIKLTSVILISLFLCSNIAFADNNVQQYSNLSPQLKSNGEAFQLNFLKGQEVISQNLDSSGLAEIVSEALPWETFNDILLATNSTSENFMSVWQEYVDPSLEAKITEALANVEKVIKELDEKIIGNKGYNPRNGDFSVATRADCWIRNQYVAEALRQILNPQEVVFVNAGQSRGTYGYYHAFVLFRVGDQWFVIDSAADQFEVKIEDSSKIGLVVMPAGRGDLNYELGGDITFTENTDTIWTFNNDLRTQGSSVGPMIYGSGTMREETYDEKITQEVNALLNSEKTIDITRLGANISAELRDNDIDSYFEYDHASRRLNLIRGLNSEQINFLNQTFASLQNMLNQVPREIIAQEPLMQHFEQVITEYVQALAIAYVEQGFFSDIGEGHGEKAREGYQKALQFLQTRIAGSEALQEQDILVMHEMLDRTTIEITPELALYIASGGMVAELGQANIPGKYRHSNLLGVARFESPKVENIPVLMNELLNWMAEQEKQLSQSNSDNIVLELTNLASKVHYLIGIIHPFVDSNGRIGRLLTNYLLSKYGFEIAGENREAYSKTLNDDFIYNFGERTRMDRVDLKDAAWNELLNLEAPNFRQFLMNHIRRRTSLVQTVDEQTVYPDRTIIIQFKNTNQTVSVEQSI